MYKHKDEKAFLKIKRENSAYRPICERVNDYREVVIKRLEDVSQKQGARCMDCGTPFCHWGCPLGSYIPEWNELLGAGNWEKALELLISANNFPEITGRVCPALCEYSCVLGIDDDPVSIRENELAIITQGFERGLIKPRPPEKRTGKKVAVVGSGPAGLAAAMQLNKAGHEVVVFEKDDKIGGVLRYGIPDFKLDKNILEKRVQFLRDEGIRFNVSINVGSDYGVKDLSREFDAICLAVGSRVPRDLNISGRELKGISFAMDYLTQNNRRVAGEGIDFRKCIDAKNKKVVIIGGGDTGSDCLGTALRQGAVRVVQIEVMPKPPEYRTEDSPWPKYPALLKTSSSHQEGGRRYWQVLAKRFIGENGSVKKIQCGKVEFVFDNKSGCFVMKEMLMSEFEIEADLVILAIGFVHPEQKGLLLKLGLDFDIRGNIKSDKKFRTNVKGVFTAGDARVGQSLVTRAISEGRGAAYHIDCYLMGESTLPVL